MMMMMILPYDDISQVCMVSANHRSQAVYKAWVMDPSNENVRHCIRTGMEGVTLLDPRSPPHIIIWFAENANDFHGVGSKTNFMQVLDLCGELTAKFNEKRKADRRDAAASADRLEDQKFVMPDDGGNAAPSQGESKNRKRGMKQSS